jgi:hypothetical protein
MAEQPKPETSDVVGASSGGDLPVPPAIYPEAQDLNTPAGSWQSDPLMPVTLIGVEPSASIAEEVPPFLADGVLDPWAGIDASSFSASLLQDTTLGGGSTQSPGWEVEALQGLDPDTLPAAIAGESGDPFGSGFDPSHEVQAATNYIAALDSPAGSENPAPATSDVAEPLASVLDGSLAVQATEDYMNALDSHDSFDVTPIV